ncbi:MAG: monovalent cation/H+ antiporter complex subunit F [Pseudomonadales bacterium]|nr:monovalent cation/H+ antiporter complex subunit F [Pseudomonadales bacterium]
MFEWVIEIVYLLLSVSLLLAFVRLAKGPSLPDRVVALELIASIVAGMVGVHAIDTGISAYLDIAIVLAITAFLAAIGFARFIQVRGMHDD